MQRLNLNIPDDAREELRRLAGARDRKEAEYARELLLDALQRARREQMFQELEQAMTPEAKRRHLEICEGMEELARGA